MAMVRASCMPVARMGCSAGACYSRSVRSTRVTHHVNAPRENVYRALLDARAVETWMVPARMTSHVHAFDPREGGGFRISLSYDEPTAAGKTTAHTDTFHGRFVKLVPGEQVVQLTEFETDDPTMQGEMTVTFTLADAGAGTDVTGVHDGLPPGLSNADNETGWRMSLAKLAAFVEAGMSPTRPEAWPTRFERALDAGDLDAVIELYEADARFVTASGEIIAGRDAIGEMLARLIAAKTRLRGRVIRSIVIDDIAMLYTDFEGTTVDASGEATEIRSDAIEVLRRQPDGTWKLIIGDPGGRGARGDRGPPRDG
jgi:uncharacterized protein (TIGR02246 family)